MDEVIAVRSGICTVAEAGTTGDVHDTRRRDELWPMCVK